MNQFDPDLIEITWIEQLFPVRYAKRTQSAQSVYTKIWTKMRIYK